MKNILLFLALALALGAMAAPSGSDRAVIIPAGPSTVVQTVETLDTIGTAMGWGEQAAVAWADVTGKPAFGTAALTAATDYATAAQGVIAGTALQPAGNGSQLTGLTKTQVGLANVDNTSDAAKPVSTATQTALDGKLATNGSAANLTSFPTLNQNTSGSAATLTTGRTINGTSFNGSANITLGNGSVTLAQMADLAQDQFIVRTTASTGVPQTATVTTAARTVLDDATVAAMLATMGGAPLASPTFTGTVVLPASTSLTTPVIGVATGTSLAVTGVLTSSGGSIGYATGAGGTVTQATNKSTGVTLSKHSGEITMNNAALAAAAIVSFTLTNTAIAATDVLVLNHVTTGTRGAYTLNAQCAAGSAVIYVRNNTAGSLGEAIVLRFALIKGSTN